jgi:hypothetical protein
MTDWRCRRAPVIARLKEIENTLAESDRNHPDAIIFESPPFSSTLTVADGMMICEDLCHLWMILNRCCGNPGQQNVLPRCGGVVFCALHFRGGF